MSIWKKIRYRLEWFGVKYLYFVIPLLPRKGAHLFSRALGSITFYADRRGRTTAIENLTLIFGEEKSRSEIRRIARDSYRSFAQTVADQFWSSRLTKENFENYCEIVLEDPEAIEKARETGAIWVTPHYSNFEWISIVLGFRDYRFTIVAQDFKNTSLTDIYKKNREVTGHEVISQRGAIVRLLKSLKRGGHAAFLTDLTVKPTKVATLIDCFGKQTCVTSIHAELMKRTGLTVMPGLCIPRPDGTYILKAFKPLKFGPDDNAQTIAQACWDIFEPEIRENPAPWLWMYKHWRYLPSGEAANYPDYSRSHEGFDRLQASITERNETGKNP